MNIVIKLPNNTRDRILTFPFLHSLHKYFAKKIEENEEEEEEVLNFHLISLKADIDILNLLPFHAYYHELDDTDVKNVFSAHRACVTFKIDRPDIYISTTESFVDASLGKQLGIKTKVGFEIGKNKWLFNKRIDFLEGQHQSVQYFNLLRAFTDELPTIPNATSRKLDPVYKDWSEKPYTVINLDLIDGKVNSEWIEFFDLFENKTFVLLCKELPLVEQNVFLQDYVNKLPTKNSYKIFIYNSNIDFGKLISYAVTLVTHESYIMHLSAYIGAYVFYLNKVENLKLTGAEYFAGNVRDFSVKGNAYAQAFDDIYAYIEEKTKQTEEN